MRWTRDGQRFARSTAESTSFVFGLFRQHGGDIADLEVRRASLEDTYLSLVRQAETGLSEAAEENKAEEKMAR